MPTFEKVNYAERVQNPNSPSWTIDGVNSRSVRVLDVDNPIGGLPVDVVPKILGFSRYNNAGYIERKLPWQNPTFGWMYATSIPNIVGVGNKRDSQGNIYTAENPSVPFNSSDVVVNHSDIQAAYRVANYQKWRCTVSYAALAYDVLPDNLIQKTAGVPDESYLQRYVTRLPRPQGDALTLPQGAMKFVDTAAGATADQRSIPFGVAKVQPSYDISLVWHWIPTNCVPSKIIRSGSTDLAIDSTLGKVNSATFDNCEPGTLLLTGAELQPDRMANGERAWHITYRMKYIAKTPAAQTDQGSHNTLIFLNTATGLIKYSEVSSDGLTHALTVNGSHLYDAADFRALFRPPA